MKQRPGSQWGREGTPGSAPWRGYRIGLGGADVRQPAWDKTEAKGETDIQRKFVSGLTFPYFILKPRLMYHFIDFSRTLFQTLKIPHVFDWWFPGCGLVSNSQHGPLVPP